MEDREKLRARLRSLLAKTTEAGCTEAEAMAAATKAAEIMREYAMSREDAYIVKKVFPISKRRNARFRLWAGIAAVTNCAAIHQHGSDSAEIVFYGFDPWPDVAEYLNDICNRAMDQAVAEFKCSDWYRRRRTTATRKRAVVDFTAGMVERLIQRLLELFADTINEEETKAAKTARDRAAPNAKTEKIPHHRQRFHEAGLAGFEAGADVPLHHGVRGGSGTTLQIGGRHGRCS